ncbi:hypothetical protein ASD97_25950 [Streptomyces sp. Root63]|uniref:hypothetical protein n=1 Tax=unclassified Streptomyces TaxID=2593676 RepID=UPI0006F44B2B|nr:MULTISPECIES: hypothetical protein [unclassified Streptomyces]KQX43519.1 hypothetical protein ASD29_32255 [Streptomyces sp. Root1295]KRA34082.1 hypothetical protein ASD97_25950 [Streptomyces sp. Root63]
MGAREELFRRVAGSFVDEDRANKLIDDLLHEEAQKIRNSPGWFEGEWMDSRDRDHAADLIDPYKEA